MRLFDDDPVDIPPVQVTDLRDDDEGQALWNQLQEVEDRRQEAEATLHRESQPLADLMAEADELAARVLVGEADEEEADAAEEEVQAARKRVEEARRTVQQCTRAEKLLREKLRARAVELHDENADVVQAVHRVLLHRALEAEKRAATLLRVLRTFEQQYARYTDDDDHAQYPQYLDKQVRTMPPRALLGAARTQGGTVFDNTEAAVWIRRAAERLEMEPPAVLDVTSLDFERADAEPEYIDPEDIASAKEGADEREAAVVEPSAEATGEDPDAEALDEDISDDTSTGDEALADEPSGDEHGPGVEDDASDTADAAEGRDSEDAALEGEEASTDNHEEQNEAASASDEAAQDPDAASDDEGNGRPNEGASGG